MLQRIQPEESLKTLLIKSGSSSFFKSSFDTPSPILPLPPSIIRFLVPCTLFGAHMLADSIARRKARHRS